MTQVTFLLGLYYSSKTYVFSGKILSGNLQCQPCFSRKKVLKGSLLLKTAKTKRWKRRKREKKSIRVTLCCKKFSKSRDQAFFPFLRS